MNTKFKNLSNKIIKNFIECNTKKNLLYKLIIFVVIIFIEMLIVFLLRNHFQQYNHNTIINNNGFINIIIISNSGIGFSVLADKTDVVYAIQSIVVIIIFIWFLFAKNIDYLITLVMIFSGALANIIDRATSGNNTVLDYFQFWFGGAIFNFADATIVCGFIALFISYIIRFTIQSIHERKIEKRKNKEKETTKINESKKIEDHDLFA